MAILTIVEATRLTGVSRSQLYRYIKAGKLSRTPEGLLDTAELLRAGLMLHVPSVPSSVSSAVPTAHDATTPPVSSVPSPVSRVPSTDTATLERLIDVLQRELDAAHERETQLLHLLAQMQQQNQRLLDMPRNSPVLPPQADPQQPRRATQPPRRVQHPPAPRSASGDPRGDMRRRIVALLQDYPEGLTPAEMQPLLGVDRPSGGTCRGMLRYGLVQRVERGRYVAVASSY